MNAIVVIYIAASCVWFGATAVILAWESRKCSQPEPLAFLHGLFFVLSLVALISLVYES